MSFIDEVEISVGSGRGAPGCVSFRRESHIPRGGPDGGDGGCGGSVIIRTTNRVNSLVHFRYKKKYQAENGQTGGGSRSSGRDGEDIVLELPAGTIIRSPEGDVLYDLNEGDEILFLKGGLGGKGNSFYKSSINQAPEYAQKGLPGEAKKIKLELKLIADVGIIGFPNAGKSTLISHISAARPKIADYPFTTLVPNLGVVDLDGGKSYVVADIPGLIEGAHQGVGLGIQFLKHIERTSMFLHIIDVSQMAERDAWDAYLAINDELKKYDDQKQESVLEKPLMQRPQIVVLNKIDAADHAKVEGMKRQFEKNGIAALAVSAATGQNVKELKYLTYEKIQQEKLKDGE